VNQESKVAHFAKTSSISSIIIFITITHYFLDVVTGYHEGISYCSYESSMILHDLKRTSLEYRPGEYCTYSIFGPSIIGMILEKGGVYFYYSLIVF
jgi:hypothetical protein